MTGTRRSIQVLAALVVLASVWWLFGPSGSAPSPAGAGAQRVAVVFTGGHETDPVDRGRPVNLIAGALGVEPRVFREAFSRVRPSRGGPPSGEQARQNKQVLMEALGPLGISNDRLDAVSNYYRYRPQEGEMWPTRDAKAFAVVESGAITGFVIVDGGSGYHVPPKATAPGHENVNIRVTLAFGADFDRNGSVAAITVEPGG